MQLDLFIEHVFSLVLLFTEASHDIGGELLLELERVLDLLDLFLFRLVLLGLLLLLGHTSALDAIKDVGIVLVELLLVCESLLDLPESHLLQVKEVLDARISYGYVDVNLGLLLLESLHNELLLLEEVSVLEDSFLLVECDVVLFDPRISLLEGGLEFVHHVLLGLPVLVLLVEHLVP